jgi:hypothetical protein
MQSLLHLVFSRMFLLNEQNEKINKLTFDGVICIINRFSIKIRFRYILIAKHT